MIRHELARIFRALADRLEAEAEKPSPEIQYVYVYNVPPVTTTPNYPVPPWQSPFYYSNTCGAN